MSKFKKEKYKSTELQWDKFGLNETSNIASSNSSDLGQDAFDLGHVALEGNELFANEEVGWDMTSQISCLVPDF